MRIALAQVSSSTDPPANLALVRDFTAAAAADGAEMVVFPEATMHSFERSPVSAAEPLDGPWASAVRAIAAEYRTTVVVGMFTTTASERVRNTLLVTGDTEASYHKIHLFDALGHFESQTIECGTKPTVVEIAGARVGLATCYDIRFPALFIHLASLGAQVMAVPASWAPGTAKVHQWRTLAAARAMDSTTFVVACGQAESAISSGRPTGVGHSLAIDPYGNALVELGTQPELALVDLDLSIVAEARDRLPVLRNACRFPPGD